MMVSVSFQTPIIAEPWPGGTNAWEVTRDGGNGVECIDKGTHILIQWTAKGTSKWAGRKCRVKVPLTNISQVFEVDDEPAKDKAKP
jgi:hypothetical protein